MKKFCRLRLHNQVDSIAAGDREASLVLIGFCNFDSEVLACQQHCNVIFEVGFKSWKSKLISETPEVILKFLTLIFGFKTWFWQFATQPTMKKFP